MIERAIIFADDRPIEPEDLTFVIKSGVIPEGVPQKDLKSALRVFEKQYILQVLRQRNFDKQTAAQDLNIGLSSLYRKIDELGLSDGGQRTPGGGE